jgi:quercetin dioxygenase-like cupin family protein
MPLGALFCRLFPCWPLLRRLPRIARQSAPSLKLLTNYPVKQNGQNQSGAILDGLTHSGDHLEVHETTLAPGSAPHPPHQHEHEELFLMMKGSLAVTIAGKTAVIGPGGAAFAHSNELHGVVNPGTENAQYFVVATGV